MLYDEGYFVFNFASIDDCEQILQVGPYSLHSKTFILQRWELKYEFNPDLYYYNTFVDYFLGLRVSYWSSEVLSKLVCAIAKPLYIDACTTFMSKISYTCSLFETCFSALTKYYWYYQLPMVSFTSLLSMIGGLNSILIAWSLGSLSRIVGIRCRQR